MKMLATGLIAGLLIAGLTAGQQPPQSTVTRAEYERWKKELSNWGRWGKDDQFGALNLITPAKREQAAALVKEGVSVSLAGDADTAESRSTTLNPYERQHARASGPIASAWRSTASRTPISIRSPTSTTTASSTTATSRTKPRS